MRFEWGVECQKAFDNLLVEAPVLAFPSFDTEFVLETDASIEGLGPYSCQFWRKMR